MKVIKCRKAAIIVLSSLQVSGRTAEQNNHWRVKLAAHILRDKIWFSSYEELVNWAAHHTGSAVSISHK